MKPKKPDKIDPLIPEILKDQIKPVDPIPETILRDEPSLWKAVPYYLLRYGENIGIIAKHIPDKRLQMILISLSKALAWLAKRYGIKNA